LIDAGEIKVFVKNIFGLDEIARAHQLIESGHSLGKTVIEIV
jgi:NADPH:quinone reductase-like Zn-dependent oxidoreductase